MAAGRCSSMEGVERFDEGRCGLHDCETSQGGVLLSLSEMGMMEESMSIVCIIYKCITWLGVFVCAILS